MPDINNTITAPTTPDLGAFGVSPKPATNSAPTPAPVAAPVGTAPLNPPSGSVNSFTPSPLAAQAKPEMTQAWDEMKNTEELKNAITGGISKQGNVDIYAMPKEFQKHNTVAGSNFSVGTFVMLSGVLLLFLAGAAAVLFYLNPEIWAKLTGTTVSTPEQTITEPIAVETPVNQVIPTATTTVATTTDPGVATSTPPKETYLAYNIDLNSVNTFSDYYALILKYGSAKRTDQIEAEKLLADASADKGVATVAAVRRDTPALDPLAQLVDVISGNTARLDVTLSDNVSKGTVDMVLENGLWKIDNESWTLAQVDDQIVYIMGEDRDKDGLTDKEENVLGSDKESADTDGDGYTDAVEVSGLYDPNKKAAKLVDSGKQGTYLAEDGSFSILRPSQWPQSKDNTDNSINFRSEDDHVIKVITMENFNKEALAAIYIKKFQLAQIDNTLKVVNDTWEGIVAPDGASIFVMPKISNDKYYILQYQIPVKTQVQEYKEIFLAMVKSFIVKN